MNTKPAVDYKQELEKAERAIGRATSQLLTEERAIKNPKDRASSTYSAAVKELVSTSDAHDRLYKKMRKAAEACDYDHAHAGYDGERWCPGCGGMTMFSRRTKRERSR